MIAAFPQASLVLARWELSFQVDINQSFILLVTFLAIVENQH